MDCCVGSTRINYGQWYVPVGKTAAECTYCEYCVNNGCISISDVTILQTNVLNCNCDCPAQKSHPRLVAVECPVCDIGGIGMGSIACCGKCERCGTWTATPSIKYCGGCSYLLKKCHECGEPVKEGNDYFEPLEKLVAERIEHYDHRSSKDEFIAKYYKSQQENFQNKLNDAKNKYSNKTADEMLILLLENRRLHH